MKHHHWLGGLFLALVSSAGCAPADQCTRYCNVCSPGSSTGFDICYDSCSAPIDRTLNWTYGADACERAGSALRECVIRTGACDGTTCQTEQANATMQCSQSFGP